VTPGQHNAAMIHFGRWSAGPLEGRRAGLLKQRSAARGAPVGHALQTQYGVAVAANAFHTIKITGSGWPLS